MVSTPSEFTVTKFDSLFRNGLNIKIGDSLKSFLNNSITVTWHFIYTLPTFNDVFFMNFGICSGQKCTTKINKLNKIKITFDNIYIKII